MKTNETPGPAANGTPTEPSRTDRPAATRPGRVRRILTRTLLLLLLLIVGGALTLELPIGRRIVASAIESAAGTAMNGTLHIGSLEGSLWHGVILRDVTVEMSGHAGAASADTVLHIETVIASYHPFRFFRTGEYALTDLMLIAPRVHIERATGDSLWNIDHLFAKASRRPSTGPFHDVIDLAHVSIQRGMLTLEDHHADLASPNALKPSAETELPLNAARMVVEQLELSGALHVHGLDSIGLTLTHVGLRERQSGFTLAHLECALQTDAHGATLRDMKFATAHSALSLDLASPNTTAAQLFGPSPEPLRALEHAQLTMRLRGPAISTHELRQFLPESLGFLDHTPALDLTASGAFGHLKIDRLALGFREHGAITIRGRLDGLHAPDSLRMDLALEARELSDATLRAYVPGLHITDLRRFGSVSIPHLTFTGEPLNFHTTFDAHSTAAGGLRTDLAIDLRHGGFRHEGTFQTDHLDLSAFDANTFAPSALSVDATISGHGTVLASLAASLAAHTTAPSVYAGHVMSAAQVHAALEHGVLFVDSSTLALVSGASAIIRSGSLDLTMPARPFTFSGTVRGLGLAEVFGREPGVLPRSLLQGSRLDLEAELSSSGTDLHEVRGAASLRLYDLALDGHALPPVVANCSMRPLASAQNATELRIESNVADLTVQRFFHLNDLVETLPRYVASLATAVRERDFAAAMTDSIPRPVSAETEPLDCDYVLRLKDLRPLASILPHTFLLADGVLHGSIARRTDGTMDLAMTADSLGVILREREAPGATQASAPDTTKPFSLPRFGTGTPRVQLVAPAHLELVATGVAEDPKRMAHSLNASLVLESDSILRTGSALLFSPKARVRLDRGELTYALSTIYNELLALELRGTGRLPSGRLELTIDTVRGTLFDRRPEADLPEYRVFNQGPARMVVSHDGAVALDTLRLVHPLLRTPDPLLASAVRVQLGGTLSGDSVRAWATVPSFRIEDLHRIFPLLKSGSNTLAFSDVVQGTVRDLAFGLRGTLARPELSVSAVSDTMRYGHGLEDANLILFDSNAIHATYTDRRIRGGMVLHVASGGELRATIDSIPLMIALSRDEHYAADSARVARQSLAARIEATRFPIDLATPFIPIFREMHGAGDIDFQLAGSPDSTLYTGHARIHDGSFLLGPTNMTYFFDGGLSFADNRLRLDSIRLRNAPSDDPFGEALVNGYFTFKGFSITDFDLALRSDRLMVLSNDSKEVLHNIYGPITGSTAGTDFHFRNTFDEPWINGNINILSAKITLPEEEEIATSSSEGIVYRTIKRAADEALDSLGHVSDLSLATAIAAALPRAGSTRFIPPSASRAAQRIEDPLFPNAMKDVRLHDDGSRHVIDLTDRDVEGAEDLLAPSFVDRLRMNVRVNTAGEVQLVMPFNGVTGMLGAQLSAFLKSNGAINVQRGDNERFVNVDGSIDLTSGSTFRFYQIFNISSGQVTFRKNFSDPELNVVAEYVGAHHNTVTGTDDQAKIELTVTGTKKKPVVESHIFTNGTTGTYEERPETAPLEDAIYFLASNGYFKSDLGANEQGTVLASVSGNLGRQLLSSMLGDYLSSTGSEVQIRSAQLNTGAGLVGAQFTAAYRSILFHYNVNTLSNFGTADYVFELPFNSFITSDNSLLRELQLELQLHSSTQTTTTTGLAQQPLFLTKIVWTPWRF